MSAVLNEGGPDAGVPWHYGDPMREQRWLAAGEATVDLRHRPVFTVTGADRLTWLNAMASQELAALPPGVPTVAYVLNHQGHITHVFGGQDDGETFLAHTEPGHLDALLTHLRRMVFAARVEIADRSDTHAMILDGGPRIVPRDDLEAALGEQRAGTWASDALRVAAGIPRAFVDTDDLTIPNEVAMPEGLALGPAVHLKKGCYPGQEAVARIYNLGRPPRRLVRLLLDGSMDALPAVGAPVLVGDKVVGRMGSSSRHYELGPIGLALVKRNLPTDAPLTVDSIAASQETLVDPEVGVHFRPKIG